MATPTINSSTIKSGPGVLRYAPLGTALPTVTAAASKLAVTWASGWVQVGGTDDGISYSESTDTSAIRVAESQYDIRTVVTGRSMTLTVNLSQIDTLNWKLAANGGTVTTSGTGATKLDEYVPPLLGQEAKVMLGFQSLDDQEALVWPQAFNVGGFDTARGTFDTKAGLPCSFTIELPDPAVLTTPYKRWTAGALATGV